VEQDGQRLVALRDPAGFTDQVAVFPVGLLALVALLDGEHSLDEILATLYSRYGEAPERQAVAVLVERLDEAGFLDSPRFRARRRAIEEAFLSAPARPAAHAGAAYPAEPEALRAWLDERLAPDGEAEPVGAAGPLRGLIAPHIDFRRGAPTYARAYRELGRRSDADLFVILGTCHAGMPDPFALTLKPYETPLGPAAVDRDFCEALARRYRGDLQGSEAAHRSEHSIEFQVVMLRYLFAERRPFSIVPVLASYVHEAMARRGDPEADPRIPRFVEALLGTMAVSGRRVCLVAGVDLAHVGPRFGDPAPNTPEALGDVERADRAMLESVVGGDPLGFYGSVAADGDARRICGLSPLYTFLRALPGVSGRLLEYRQWPDPQGAVTFCAVVFP
jgi:hypothetical protein